QRGLLLDLERGLTLGSVLSRVDVADSAQHADENDEHEEGAASATGILSRLNLSRQEVDARLTAELDDVCAGCSLAHALPPRARPSATVQVDRFPGGTSRDIRTPPKPSSTLTGRRVSSPSMSENPGICETPPMSTMRSRAPAGRE